MSEKQLKIAMGTIIGVAGVLVPILIICTAVIWNVGREFSTVVATQNNHGVMLIEVKEDNEKHIEKFNLVYTDVAILKKAHE